MCYCYTKICKLFFKKNGSPEVQPLNEELMLTVVGPQPFIERGEHCFPDFWLLFPFWDSVECGREQTLSPRGLLTELELRNMGHSTSMNSRSSHPLKEASSRLQMLPELVKETGFIWIMSWKSRMNVMRYPETKRKKTVTFLIGLTTQ